MQRIVNHSFFKFFLGFIVIILFSFIATGFVARFSDQTVDPTTQTACETEEC